MTRAIRFFPPIASVAMVLLLMGGEAVRAQEAGAGGRQASEREDADIVVTGMRRSDLTAAQAPLPIDIVSGDKLVDQGVVDMNDVLRSNVPGFNVQRPVTNDGAVFTRAFSLRGLPSDQTLVLVNGKRRHRGATVQTSTIPYVRGSQGPDIAAIPTIAIKQLEVLRDGASATYGSDAIAGVLNFRLRDDRDGGLIIARYGQFYKGGGSDYLVQANVGLPFTQEGFVNISAEYSKSGATSRGTQRPDAQALINAGVKDVPVPAQRWGNPNQESARLFINAGLTLSEDMDFYAFGNYGWLTAATQFFYRPPSGAIFRSVPLTTTPGGARFSFSSLFPGGFTPNWAGTVRDSSIVAGVKGELDVGLTYDASASYGTNRAAYRVSNTINPSLGPKTPTSFRPGRLAERDLTLNLDFSYPWDVGFAAPLTFAFGAEYRRETWEASAGDPASFEAGPFASLIDPDTGNRVGLPVGSSGYPGIGTIQAGVFPRSNWASYLALETDITDAWTVAAAIRYEDFSDFGSTFNWKLNSRLELADWVAVRGSVNTGFRAPTPGQSHTYQVQTNINFTNGQTLTAGIVPVDNPVALLFGGKPLTPEKAFNVTGGLAFTPLNNLSLTIDYYNIKVSDRITLSGNFFLTDAQRAQLAASGVPGGGSFDQASFFTNAFATRTQGVDMMLAYGFDLAGGRASLNGNLNYNKTKVLRASSVIASDRERLIEYEDFVPDWKGAIGIDYFVGKLGLKAKASYLGSWMDAGDVPANDQKGKAVVFIDAEASYDISDALTIAAGGENIFDRYPSRERRVSQTNSGIRYMRFAPSGFNGGFWYLRATAKF